MCVGMWIVSNSETVTPPSTIHNPSADTRPLAESAPGCSLQIGAKLEANRGTMMSSDPRSWADLWRTAFVVATMKKMLTAIFGAQRAARSAVKECILMFRKKILDTFIGAVNCLSSEA